MNFAAFHAFDDNTLLIARCCPKIASFISSTMPYSLIIIGVILIVLVICLCFAEMIGGAGGSVAGGGAWLVDDNSNQTPNKSTRVTRSSSNRQRTSWKNRRKTL